MKKIVLLLTVMLCSLSLFATGQKEEESSDSGKINLRMAVWDVNNVVYQQKLVDAYIAENPNVTIEFVNAPSNEYIDKVSIMLSGGDDVDLISIKDIPSYGGLIGRNNLEPLDSFIQKDNWNLDQYSGLTNDIIVDNKLYALPFRSDIWVLFYNKDIFDAAGVSYPDNDMTWDEYAELAKKVSSGSGVDRVYGAHHHVWRSTVQLATVQDGRNNIVSDDYSFMKPMYDMIIGLQDDGTIMDYSSLKVGNMHYSGLFYNEDVAMVPMGSWFSGGIMKNKLSGDATMNWGIVKFPHPAGVAAGTTAGTITSLAMNSKSKNKEAAWDFIKFYTGPEGAIILAESGNFPAIKSDDVLDIIANQEGFPTDSASKEALSAGLVRIEFPIHPQVSVIERILNEEHELIMTESVTVDEGLAEMTRRVKEALGQ